MRRDRRAWLSTRGFKTALETALSYRHLPLALGILAILLTLPSLRVGLLLDDCHHKLLMQGSDSVLRLLDSPLDMFRYFNGDPARNAELIDYGFLPWWASRHVKGACWRPLASLTHWLDYILWPEHPALMHAHCLLWYGALAFAVTLLYRRLMAPLWVAGLAALLYAIDDAHGTPVGFLANRNALMATLLGVLALMAHDRWRRDGWRLGAVLGPLLLAASLLSAEAGIATCAYLAAHALFIDRGTRRQRLAAMSPYVGIVVAWRIVWTHLGYGVHNLGLYVDPGNDLLGFVPVVVKRAPLLLLGQWAFPPSELHSVFSPRTQTFLWLGAALFLVLLAILLVPLFRRDRTARFWALGMVLSVIPICATYPIDRLLLFVGIGAMGLLAQFLALVYGRAEWRPRQMLWRIPALGLGFLFIVIHVIVAPLGLPVRAADPLMTRGYLYPFQIHAPLDPSVENQDLVVINPPVATLVTVQPVEWAAWNQPVPKRMRVLASSMFRRVTVYRRDERTLVVRPECGYLAHFIDRAMRAEEPAYTLGERVELTGMTVEITELTSDHRPAEAAFRFAVPLEDPSLRWLIWRGGAFVPFKPPPVGESAVLPASKSAARRQTSS